MKYVTYFFQYASYFPAVGFFIGMLWGFVKSNSNRGGSMGLVMSVLIGGAIGMVAGFAAKFFAYYVTTAESHPGLY